MAIVQYKKNMNKEIIKKTIPLTVFALCFIYLNLTMFGNSYTGGHKGFPYIHELLSCTGTIKNYLNLFINYLLASTVLALGTVLILKKEKVSKIALLCIFSFLAMACMGCTAN